METKKALKVLDKQIKKLFDLMMMKNNGPVAGTAKESEDDAMFTRKPLGGVSCASCEKGISNL